MNFKSTVVPLKSHLDSSCDNELDTLLKTKVINTTDHVKVHKSQSPLAYNLVCDHNTKNQQQSGLHIAFTMVLCALKLNK